LPVSGGDYMVVLSDKTQLTLSLRYRTCLDNFLRQKIEYLPRSV
jgi:hypothetical protein